ncbi:unnamed protein product [Auanema sp. JU1783]|nr:unnamed protein product [Auanema sp. JU1783]
MANIVFSVPTMTDKGEILQFLFKYFITQESMSRAAKITEEQFRPCAEEILDSSLKVPFSVIAREKETNELAGILLQSIWEKSEEDIENQYSFGTPNQSPSGSIAFVLNQLHNSFYKLVPDDVSRVLHREMSCVAAKFQRQGIAKRMALYHLENPKLNEFKIQGIASETSSQANQALLQKLGYKTIKEVHFKNIVDADGKPTLICDDGTEKAVLNYLKI